MSSGRTSLAARNSGVILNVNDDEGNRLLISEVLRRGGFTIHEADCGMRALEQLTEAIDVVVLDVNLPDIDGFEVCRRIKADSKTASVLVLLLSAQSIDLTDRVTGLEEGADGYLTQPLEPAELVAVVKSFLRLRRAEQAHAREARRAKLAAELVVTLNDSQPLKVDLERCVSAFIDWLAVDAVGIWLSEAREQRLILAATKAANRIETSDLQKEVTFDRQEALPTWFDSEVGDETVEHFGLRGAESEWLIECGLRSGVSYPLIVDGRYVGLLELYSRRLRATDLLNDAGGPAAALALGIQRKQTSDALKASEEISQRRQNRVRELEKELLKLERLASSSSTIVTSRSYGSSPLRESHIEPFEELVEQFCAFLQQALEQRSHRVDHRLTDRLREFGDRIGFLRAGPRDVIEIYSAALTRMSSNTAELKERAFVEEGRILVLELMGNVLSYYRAASFGAVRTVSRERSREGSPKGTGDE